MFRAVVLFLLLLSHSHLAAHKQELGKQPVCVIGAEAPCSFVGDVVNVIEHLEMHHLLQQSMEVIQMTG